MNVRDRSIGEFIEKLAERRAAPAGGAVAALCAAQGSALVLMVARYSTDRPGLAADDEEVSVSLVVSQCELLAARSLELAEQDVVAFEAVMSARALPQQTEESKIARSEAIQAALVAATESQAGVAVLGIRLVALVEELVPKARLSVSTDLAAAVVVVQAALSIARLNMEANLAGIKNPRIRERFQTHLRGIDLALGRVTAITATIFSE